MSAVATRAKLPNDWRPVELLLRDAFYLLGVPVRERGHGELCVISYHEAKDGTCQMEFVFPIEALARLLTSL